MRARPVFTNRLVFLTRSVSRQEFRLRPSAEVNEAIRYMLMATSRRYQMSPSCLCVMSNHWHGVVHDKEGRLPAFLSEFHGLLAHIINHIHGDSGRLWDGAQSHRLYLDDNESVLQEIAYTMSNPVAAGLLRHGNSWPGVRQCWPVREVVVRRPAFFEARGMPPKRPKGRKCSRPTVREVDAKMKEWDKNKIHYPPYMVFRLHRPPGFDELSDEQLAATLRRAVAMGEEMAHEKRLKEGKKEYLGARLVKKMPRKSVPKKMRQRFSMIPQVKARDWEATRAAKEQMKGWHRAYEEAYRLTREGLLAVEFPIGTYLQAVYHGARVSSAAPPGC